MSVVATMAFSRRNLLALAAVWPLTARAHARQTTPTAGAGGEATVRGDAGQTGRMPGPGPITAPRALWSVPGFNGSPMSPVAMGDLVFGMGERITNAALVALDAATGIERWRIERGPWLGPPGAAAYADGAVFVGTREPDGELRPVLRALEAATGEERWGLPLPGAVFPDEWLIPLAAGGVVYVAALDGHAYALDAATGQQRWRVEVGNVSFQQPALADGVLVFLHEEGLLALDAATGHERWRGGPRGGWSVTVDGGRVYASGRGASGSEGVLHVLDAASGGEVWSFTGATGMSIGELAVAGGTVYASGSREFYALDAETGDVRWQRERSAYHSPAVVGDVLYVPSGSDFHALDGATGAEVWTAPGWGDAIGGGGSITGPAVVGGRIFLYANSNRLVALGDAAGATVTPLA